MDITDGIRWDSSCPNSRAHMAMEGSKTFNPASTTLIFLSSSEENNNSQAYTHIEMRHF